MGRAPWPGLDYHRYHLHAYPHWRYHHRCHHHDDATAQEREWQICEIETRFGLGHSRQGARDPTLQVGVDVDDGGDGGVGGGDAIKSF